jgi:hypothetical protein
MAIGAGALVNDVSGSIAIHELEPAAGVSMC